ncbi:MAG: hypothetical protein K6F51_02820 [Acetatifactor sp.]|nr:hypothetical protein [Acetatifactor sp.]
MKEPWMEDELVHSIPKEKLDLLSKLFTHGQGKTQKELLREILPLLKEAKEKGLAFTPSEMSSAIAAIRKHSSAEDNAKIDDLIKNVSRGRVS